MNYTIVSFGEVLWDLLPTGKLLGGAPFNLAYRVNSLGDRGIIASRLGEDALGKEACSTVAALGLDTAYLQRDSGCPTGTVRVSFDTQNNPDYFIVPEVAYDHIQANDDLLELASSADCISFGTLAQRSSQNRISLAALLDASGNSLKLCDINLRKDCYCRETVVSSLERADILKMNEDEARLVARMLEFPDTGIVDICDKLVAGFYLSFCSVTLARNGAYSVSAGGESEYVPGYAIQAVDSLGTGDAFSAGFVNRILRKKPLREAVELGNKLATLVAARRGATPVISHEELESFPDIEYQRNIHPEFT